MSDDPFQRLDIPQCVYDGMIWQALAERPLECCGLLAGTLAVDGVAQVRLRYPLHNAAASAVEFESEAASLFSALRDIRRRQLQVLAVYHSHPTSAAIPSRKDRERNWSCDIVNFIVSLTTTPPCVRGWWLTPQTHRAAEWKIA